MLHSDWKHIWLVGDRWNDLHTSVPNKINRYGTNWSLTNSIASSTFFTVIMGRIGPNISLCDFSSAVTTNIKRSLLAHQGITSLNTLDNRWSDELLRRIRFSTYDNFTACAVKQSLDSLEVGIANYFAKIGWLCRAIWIKLGIAELCHRKKSCKG